MTRKIILISSDVFYSSCLENYSSFEETFKRSVLLKTDLNIFRKEFNKAEIYKYSLKEINKTRTCSSIKINEWKHEHKIDILVQNESSGLLGVGFRRHFITHNFINKSNVINL